MKIFDSYRRDIDFYDLEWRKEYAWINLAHVCRKWRAVMFASCSRLDLGVTVGHIKPTYIKTILSGTLPIYVDYKGMYGGVTSSALWCMRAALEHPDRVREIAFEGTDANFNDILKVTQCAFPVLEGLILHFQDYYRLKLPDTFLRGLDPSDLHLRRIKLQRVSIASISGFLLSATAVTDLSLRIDADFGQSPETSLLTCLQGMPCLRRLNLSISSGPPLRPPMTPNHKDIVSLSKLTGFRYYGHGIFFDALAAGLSAPSLRDVNIQFFDGIPPIVHLPRFICEIEEDYHAFHVVFCDCCFCLSLQTKSEYINHCKPRFELRRVLGHVPVSIIRMSGVLSTKLATVEELRVTFKSAPFDKDWENEIPWREFLQHFPSLKAFRTENALNDRIARTLLRNHGEPNGDLAFLPALEEIELGEDLSFTDDSDSDGDERERGAELAAFEPIVSARKQAGCPIKVFFSP